MKKITSIWAGMFVVLALPFTSHAITNTAIAISGTNLVLSWPSYGYESYLVQYRQTLDSTDSWSQLVNAYPAATNRTIYTLYGLVPPPAVGGGGSGSVVAPPTSMAAVAATAPGLFVISADGSGPSLPLAIFPPGSDLSGYLIYDPTTGTTTSGSDYSVTSLNAAYANFGGGLTPDSPQPNGGPVGGSSGDSANPTTGFYRVFHIPDWLADFSGYTFTGPTFIPVDFESPDAPVDYVDSATVLVNGQPTDNALLMPYVISGVTNWGVGVYFDRFPNGVATIQLQTFVRQSGVLNDQTPYMAFSNAPATITIGSAISFTNWSDLILSNTYTFCAQSATPNVDWEIDIYDVYNNFVNYQTGHSSDGNISWTWNLTDYNGASRIDDSDPFFYPEITITPTANSGGQVHPNAGGGSTTKPMPPVASQFPSAGDWLFCYLDKDYDDGSTNYPGGTSTMIDGIYEMAGGPELWNLSGYVEAIKFGRTYLQSERNDSWKQLEEGYIQAWSIRNFYYYGHGSPGSIGGDQNTVDSSNYVTGSINLPGGHAYLTSQWVHDNVTFNKSQGAQPYRFAFLDGCNTAGPKSTWPWAWGVPSEAKDLSYYQSTNNATKARPSAFVGWDVEVGGKDWGTIDKFWQFRKTWMATWSVQSYGGNPASIADAFETARNNSGWVPNQVQAHLKEYGYVGMTFRQFNNAGDWP